MDKRYTVLVINGIFDDENITIVKTNGSTSTRRFDNTITSESLRDYLEGVGVDIDDCRLIVLDEDWKGNPKVEQF